jgi:hypothetical protein
MREYDFLEIFEGLDGRVLAGAATRPGAKQWCQRFKVGV